MFKVKHVLKCFAGWGPYLISFQGWCESTWLDPACVAAGGLDNSDPPLLHGAARVESWSARVYKNPATM